MVLLVTPIMPNMTNCDAEVLSLAWHLRHI
jgi:hypothetical protein